MVTASEQILPGIWHFSAAHPEWTAEEGGEEGWDPVVSWYALATPSGLVLVDPLVEDWPGLDGLVARSGGCAAIARTCHWHQRSVAEAAQRYRAAVWAKPRPGGPRFDHRLAEGDELAATLRVFDEERADEVAFWLPEARAVIFGDAMLRRADGTLRVCPDSWTQPDGGPARLRALLARFTELSVEHVLVSHGPCVLGDGLAQLSAALGE